MLIRRAPDIRSSEITDEKLFLDRREFIRSASSAAAGVMAPAVFSRPSSVGSAEVQTPLPVAKKSPLSTNEPWNSYEDITSYNNFYEFGIDKGDPKRRAGSLKTRPWSVALSTRCAKRRRRARSQQGS